MGTISPAFEPGLNKLASSGLAVCGAGCILQRARDGDSDAVEELVNQYQKEVLNGARKGALEKVIPWKVAADEARVHIWKKFQHPEKKNSLPRCSEGSNDCSEGHGGWFYIVARNAVLDLAKSELKRLERERKLGQERLRTEPEPRQGPERTVVGADFVEWVLSQLTDVHREVVALHFICRWPPAEVAMEIGLSDARTRQVIADARRALKRIVNDYKESDEES